VNICSIKHQWEGLKILTEHDRLEVGVVYAVRPSDGSMYCEPAVHLGRTWKQMPDGRRLSRAAWALSNDDGSWRPDWSTGPLMRWDDYLALPEEKRPR
jgi:hypothetical protein